MNLSYFKSCCISTETLEVAEKYAFCIQQAKISPQDYKDLNNQLNTLLLDCR
jgi:hypothetical protein